MPVETIPYDPKSLIGIPAVAKMLGRSCNTIRRQILSGALINIKWVDLFGNGRLQAPVEDVRNYIKTRTTQTETALRPRTKRHR